MQAKSQATENEKLQRRKERLLEIKSFHQSHVPLSPLRLDDDSGVDIRTTPTENETYDNSNQLKFNSQSFLDTVREFYSLPTRLTVINSNSSVQANERSQDDLKKLVEIRSFFTLPKPLLSLQGKTPITQDLETGPSFSCGPAGPSGQYNERRKNLARSKQSYSSIHYLKSTQVQAKDDSSQISVPTSAKDELDSANVSKNDAIKSQSAISSFFALPNTISPSLPSLNPSTNVAISTTHNSIRSSTATSSAEKFKNSSSTSPILEKTKLCLIKPILRHKSSQENSYLSSSTKQVSFSITFNTKELLHKLEKIRSFFRLPKLVKPLKIRNHATQSLDASTVNHQPSFTLDTEQQASTRENYLDTSQQTVHSATTQIEPIKEADNETAKSVIPYSIENLLSLVNAVGDGNACDTNIRPLSTSSSNKQIKCEKTISFLVSEKSVLHKDNIINIPQERIDNVKSYHHQLCKRQQLKLFQRKKMEKQIEIPTVTRTCKSVIKKSNSEDLLEIRATFTKEIANVISTETSSSDKSLKLQNELEKSALLELKSEKNDTHLHGDDTDPDPDTDTDTVPDPDTRAGAGAVHAVHETDSGHDDDDDNEVETVENNFNTFLGLLLPSKSKVIEQKEVKLPESKPVVKASPRNPRCINIRSVKASNELYKIPSQTPGLALLQRVAKGTNPTILHENNNSIRTNTNTNSNNSYKREQSSSKKKLVRKPSKTSKQKQTAQAQAKSLKKQKAPTRKQSAKSVPDACSARQANKKTPSLERSKLKLNFQSQVRPFVQTICSTSSTSGYESCDSSTYLNRKGVKQIQWSKQQSVINNSVAFRSTSTSTSISSSLSSLVSESTKDVVKAIPANSNTNSNSRNASLTSEFTIINKIRKAFTATLTVCNQQSSQNERFVGFDRFPAYRPNVQGMNDELLQHDDTLASKLDVPMFDHAEVRQKVMLWRKTCQSSGPPTPPTPISMHGDIETPPLSPISTPSCEAVQ